MQNRNGCKIVVKRSTSTCVRITSETYRKIVDMIEDYKLYLEAEERMKNTTDSDFISQEEIMCEFGITQEHLDAIDEVEIE